MFIYEWKNGCRAQDNNIKLLLYIIMYQGTKSIHEKYIYINIQAQHTIHDQFNELFLFSFLVIGFISINPKKVL